MHICSIVRVSQTRPAVGAAQSSIFYQSRRWGFIIFLAHVFQSAPPLFPPPLLLPSTSAYPHPGQLASVLNALCIQTVSKLDAFCIHDVSSLCAFMAYSDTRCIYRTRTVFCLSLPYFPERVLNACEMYIIYIINLSPVFPGGPGKESRNPARLTTAGTRPARPGGLLPAPRQPPHNCTG